MLVIKNVSALHYCTIKMSERFYDGVEREREWMWMGGRGEMNQCISLPQSRV